MDELLQSAPLAVVQISQDDTIIAANRSAGVLGLTEGSKISDHIKGFEGSFQQAMRAEHPRRHWVIRREEAEKRVRITPVVHTDGFYLWVDDLTEQISLSEKLRKQSGPEIRLLKQINHQAVTAMGYAELLDVITEDHEMISGEKLNAVRQYLRDISRALRVIQQIAARENVGTEHSQFRVLVVEAHAALSELISELLRAEGYKVEAFSDADAALKYFALNHHAVRKAVIDETLRGQSGSLIDELRQLSPGLDIVTLTDRADNDEPGSVLKPLDFQLLLRAVEGLE